MAALTPKKDGSPNAEFFQSPEVMQGFEQVRQWLQKNCKKVSIRRASTAILRVYATYTAQAHSIQKQLLNNQPY